MPINKDLAGAQIEYIQNHVQFQSTLAYLKNPPPGYSIPSVDIVAGLDNIAKKAAHGQYTDQLSFELDIYSLITSAEDGHFVYVSFLLGAFAYTRDASLVSLSFDGVQESKVYVESKCPYRRKQ